MPTDPLTRDTIHRKYNDGKLLKIQWSTIEWDSLEKFEGHYYIGAKVLYGATTKGDSKWVPLRFVRFNAYYEGKSQVPAQQAEGRLRELKDGGGEWEKAYEKVMKATPDVDSGTLTPVPAFSPPSSPIQTAPQIASSSSSGTPLAKGKTKAIKLPSAGTDAETLIRAAGDMAYPGIVDSTPGPSSTLTKTERARQDAHATNERDQGRAGTRIALSDRVVINYPHGEDLSDLPPGPTKTNVHRYYKPGGVPVKPEATNRAFEAYKRWGGKYKTTYLSYL